MRKKAGIICVISGVVLIISALLLLQNNRREDIKAGEKSEELLYALMEEISEEDTQQYEETESLPEPMPVKSVMGYDCIGKINIPSLSLALPVLSSWDYYKLKIAPCRHFGSVETENLVIAAHNYKKHFAYLKNLVPGDEVIFTDTAGNIIRYKAAEIKLIKPTDVKQVEGSSYPLTLYTCTPGGKSRVAVFCEYM